MKRILCREIGKREIYYTLEDDYNTNNYTVEELEELCRVWEQKDAEEEAYPAWEYWVEEKEETAE